MTTDRIRLTTWVRPWTAEITRRGAREEGMTLSAYVALVLEGNCDPDVDSEHPEYRGPKQPPAAPERSADTLLASPDTAEPQRSRHAVRDVSEMPESD
jgi:hypothetical protein